MAEQRIRASKLPEIIAQFGDQGPGTSLQAGIKGFKEGAEMASILAARKKESELRDLQMKQIEKAIADAKAKKDAQSQLFEAQNKHATLGPSTPISSIPMGPQGSLPTLSDAALTSPVETSNFTGGRGKDLYVDQPDGTTRHALVPETQMGIEQQPTGDAGTTLIPGMQDELSKQIEQYKREAYPEQYGKSLFQDQVSDLDKAKTETERAKTKFLQTRTSKAESGPQDTQLDKVSQAQKVAEQAVDNAYKYGIPVSRQQEAADLYDREYRKALKAIEGNTSLENEVVDLGNL